MEESPEEEDGASDAEQIEFRPHSPFISEADVQADHKVQHPEKLQPLTQIPQSAPQTKGLQSPVMMLKSRCKEELDGTVYGNRDTAG